MGMRQAAPRKSLSGVEHGRSATQSEAPGGACQGTNSLRRPAAARALLSQGHQQGGIFLRTAKPSPSGPPSRWCWCSPTVARSRCGVGGAACFSGRCTPQPATRSGVQFENLGPDVLASLDTFLATLATEGDSSPSEALSDSKTMADIRAPGPPPPPPPPPPSPPPAAVRPSAGETPPPASPPPPAGKKAGAPASTAASSAPASSGGTAGEAPATSQISQEVLRRQLWRFADVMRFAGATTMRSSTYRDKPPRSKLRPPVRPSGEPSISSIRPPTFPRDIADRVTAIIALVDEIAACLGDPVRRAQYDLKVTR